MLTSSLQLHYQNFQTAFTGIFHIFVGFFLGIGGNCQFRIPEYVSFCIGLFIYLFI
jgi:hypothetical protein